MHSLSILDCVDILIGNDANFTCSYFFQSFGWDQFSKESLLEMLKWVTVNHIFKVHWRGCVFRIAFTSCSLQGHTDPQTHNWWTKRVSWVSCSLGHKLLRIRHTCLHIIYLLCSSGQNEISICFKIVLFLYDMLSMLWWSKVMFYIFFFCI